MILQDQKSTVHPAVDSTDVLVCEPQPFHAQRFSQKFQQSALRYEIGISVNGGNIVWVQGPSPAGRFNDQTIFNLKMVDHLKMHEKILADKDYSGKQITHSGVEGDEDSTRTQKLRANHKRMNGRLKMFGCIDQRWRHLLDKHHVCFFAVSNLIHFEIKLSRPLVFLYTHISVDLTINAT